MPHSQHILIPDGNSTWAMPVINCLSQCNDYKLFVISSKKRTAAKYSKYKSYYKYYKRTTDADWLKIVNNEIETQNISVVIPIAENEIRFFIKYSNQISKKAKIILLPELNAFETAINKLALSEFLVKNNLPHPKSLLVNDFKSIESIIYPVLVKPLSEKGGDGILRFETAKNFKKYAKDKELFVQHYIEGYDIDCSVLCINGKVLTYTIQKGCLQGDTVYAPQLGLDFIENESVLEVTKQLMDALNWSGVAHVDLRYDQKANDYKIIEVNARFWGSVEASKVAGINFPELVIQAALGEIITHKPYSHINYLRFKGFLKTVKIHPSSLFRLNFILNNTEVKSVLKDPLPTLFRFLEWLLRPSLKA